MKFIISRTSDQWVDGQKPSPCDEATLETTICTESWWMTQEQFDGRYGAGAWLSKGTDHRTIAKEGGQYIVRNIGTEPEWSVELGTLTDLVAFLDKYGGQLVLKRRMGGEAEIEIYDGYRE
jgi:hypothetical protein